jgi:hypothetical protein
MTGPRVASVMQLCVLLLLDTIFFLMPASGETPVISTVSSQDVMRSNTTATVEKLQAEGR